MGGFVKQNQITILVNSAESKDKIDAGAEKLFRSTEAAE
jgi:F0F1-type ATP synthase epsilon subunit